ncbi:MAG: MerC domain-containing protein [Ferruginibacter sp.]
MDIKVNWDGLGIFTSLACAIHCAILPLIATSLPLFGINIIHNGYFEWGMISIAFVVGSYSLFHGYIKHHRSFLPIIVFTIGFLFLISKQFFASLEIALLVPAVILIVTAHYLNYRLCQKSKCMSPHHKH